MLKQIGTWKLRWNILAFVAVLFLGVTTLTDAKEKKPKKSATEIQAKIDKLQIQLQKVKETEKETLLSPWLAVTEVSPARIKMLLVGRYLGTEGDDKIGIVLEQPKDEVYPITIYEDGLPENGYDPADDNKYVGIATIGSNEDNGQMWLNIALKQKFDEAREERVEPALREFKAAIELKKKKDGVTVSLTALKNKEWDAIRVSKEKSAPSKTTSTSVSVSPPNIGSLAGSYSGREGDDKLGLVLTPSKNGEGEYDVVFYEDGLPGAGHDPKDDDRYEGTATFKNNQFEIQLTKKFDEGKEERVEKSLHKITATVNIGQEGNVKIEIPKSIEWDSVHLTKPGGNQ